MSQSLSFEIVSMQLDVYVGARRPWVVALMVVDDFSGYRGILKFDPFGNRPGPKDFLRCECGQETWAKSTDNLGHSNQETWAIQGNSLLHWASVKKPPTHLGQQISHYAPPQSGLCGS